MNRLRRRGPLARGGPTGAFIMRLFNDLTAGLPETFWLDELPDAPLVLVLALTTASGIGGCWGPVG